MKDYQYIVLGADLENSGHADHDATKTIIKNNVFSYSTNFFGYIAMGTTTDYSLSDVQTKVDDWLDTMGVQGIFLDEFGYDYGRDREWQCEVLNYIHNTKGSIAFINAWDPADVYADKDGNATCATVNDIYLAESFAVSNGLFQPTDQLISKANSIVDYQNSMKDAYDTANNVTDGRMFRVATVTTTYFPYNPHMFYFSWFTAFLYDFHMSGWGQPLFSSLDNAAPYHQRPVFAGYDYGNIEGSIQSFLYYGSEGIYYRSTSSGYVFTETVSHIGGFIPTNLVGVLQFSAVAFVLVVILLVIVVTSCTAITGIFAAVWQFFKVVRPKSKIEAATQ
jgi:hypothetical protein